MTRARLTARAVLAVCVAVALLSTACTSGGGAAGSETITVLAAASLREPFTELGAAFEEAHPGTTVRFSFAGSSELAQQVLAGSPADVLAAANPSVMELVTSAGLATTPAVFATNTLAVAVPAGSEGTPVRVTSLADLSRPGVAVALCQPAVPCGSAAAQLLEDAGLDVTPVTLEPDVRAVLTKVRLGEVDAGIVYTTDVLSALGDVVGIEVPDEHRSSVAYPVVALTGAPPAAEAFVDLVLSPAGRAVLADAGFGPP